MISEFEKKKYFLVSFTYIATVLLIFYIFLKFFFWTLSPFIIALFIAMLLQKPVEKLTEKTRVGRGLWSMLLVLIVVGVIGLFIGFLVNEIATTIKEFIINIKSQFTNSTQIKDTMVAFINTKLHMLPINIKDNFISNINKMYDVLTGAASDNSGFSWTGMFFNSSIFKNITNNTDGILSSIKRVPVVLVGILVSIICCCFMTSDYKTVRTLILKLSRSHAENLIRTKRIVFSTLKKLFKAYGLIMLITFAELSLFLYIFKFAKIYTGGYIFVIAGLTAIIDIVPVLGTGTVLWPWAIWEFILGNYKLGIAIIVMYIVITIIRQVIEPKLIAGQLGIPAFLELMAMYIGSQLFGFIGIFIMPVFIMIIKVLNDDGIIHLFGRKTVEKEFVVEEKYKND